MRTLTTLITLVILCLCLCVPAIAQDQGVPDSLIFGEDGNAFSYPGNKIRIPVFYWSDTPLSGIQFGVEFGLGGGALSYDSTSAQFSIFREGYLDLGIQVLEAQINGIMPDSVGVAGIALFQDKFAPPGRHKICDIWLEGASVGEQLTLDTTFIPPYIEILFVSEQSLYYVPQTVVGGLMVVEGSSIIVADNPEQVQVNAGEELILDVSAEGFYPPIAIALDSLVRLDEYAEPQNAPTTFGTNPLTFQWLPNPFEGNSYWRAHFTAVDAADYEESFSVEVAVLGAGAYYGVIGDCDCSGNIDVDDVVFLLNFVFHGGPAPKCE